MTMYACLHAAGNRDRLIECAMIAIPVGAPHAVSRRISVSPEAAVLLMETNDAYRC
jgi:hypothetical protein